jgi:hypothetical protein
LASNEGGDGGRYESPELVAIGSLHDLLAGNGGTQCDNESGSVSDGHDGVDC